MSPDLLYQIALTAVPNVGAVQAKLLTAHFNNARDIFAAKEYQLKKIEGIGEVRARSIKAFQNFKDAEKEIRFIEKYQVQPLFLTNPKYPQRLLNCYDSPTLLYFKGNADLNASRIVSIIGTRNNTAYGRQLTEKLITSLVDLEILVVSGLAYGIDAIAHQSCLHHKIPTVGVLAHGLDQIYPPQHQQLAREMVGNGGLLTEFLSATMPDKHNFPIRNRIVAGMSDATIVIETGVRGGSIITAELANGYNRDVFAFPGRVTDDKSTGCNYLIKNNKAMLLTDAADLLDCMNWIDNKPLIAEKQRKIFVDLNPEEKILLDLLQEKEAMHIDELRLRSGLSSSVVARAILSLEMQHIIGARPGKLYSIQ